MEKTLLVVVALNVCSLPWMLGGMRVWAQFISLGLSVLAFAIALVPRIYEGDLVHGDAYRLHPHRKLLRWPLWWIGLIFFGYVLIQALNPAWEFVQMENSWGMRQIPHIEWLPTGMRTPFEMMNPWRQMMIWLAPFLTASGIWMGFTRSKTIIRLLTFLVINAAILACIGIIARFTAPGEILWLVTEVPEYCFSSFIYKNHAGSFFLLSIGLTLALVVWHYRNALRRSSRSNAAGLFLFFVILLLVALLQTHSRAAILLLGAYLPVFFAIAVFKLIRQRSARSLIPLIAIMCLILAGLATIGSRLVDTKEIQKRFNSLTDGNRLDQSVVGRQLAWEAGLDMSSESPGFGWGAGGFRFLFPKYQQAYPSIQYHIHPNGVRQLAFWEHAHNDYLQLLIETGRVGIVLLFGSLIAILVSFSKTIARKNPTAWALGGAMMLPMAHATVDFPMQNPAILTTFAVTAVLSLACHKSEVRQL